MSTYTTTKPFTGPVLTHSPSNCFCRGHLDLLSLYTLLSLKHPVISMPLTISLPWSANLNRKKTQLSALFAPLAQSLALCLVGFISQSPHAPPIESPYLLPLITHRVFIEGHEMLRKSKPTHLNFAYSWIVKILDIPVIYTSPGFSPLIKYLNPSIVPPQCLLVPSIPYQSSEKLIPITAISGQL